MVLRALLTFVVLSFSFLSAGQTKVLIKPKKYLAPTGEILPVKAARMGKEILNPYWQVYTDGQGSNCFLDFECKKEAGQLEPFSSFYVTNEKSDVIQVASGGTLDEKTGIISGYKSLSWARKESLILWDRSLFSNTFSRPVHLYPVLSSDAELATCLRVRTMMPDLAYDSIRFFYPLKYSGNKVLISSTQSLKGGALDSKILGWFDRSLFTVWDGRSVFFLSRKDTLSIPFDAQNIQTIFVRNPKDLMRSHLVYPFNDMILLPWIQNACTTKTPPPEGFTQTNDVCLFAPSVDFLSVTGNLIPVPSNLSKNRGNIVQTKNLEQAAEYFKTYIKDTSYSDRKKILQHLPLMLGYLNPSFSTFFDELSISELGNFFAGNLKYYEEDKGKLIADYIGKKNMTDSDIKYFIESLEKLVHPGKEVFEASFMILDEIRTNKFRLYKNANL